ncbi:hypothetical protein CAP35_01505 [Chitinophagaceae bacterium IBVUCB1]|nr:hypothetical protein CAP35_01505 [Chitinophagaceae bacterium IBVUCB1]
MKKRLFAVLMSCIVAILVAHDACVKDKCRQVVCNNGGVCVAGVCACPAGYEGVSCSQMWNEKFAGRWQAADSVAKDNITRYKYEITNNIGNNRDSFYMAGFADTVSMQIMCTRQAYRSFKIPEQKIDSFLILKSGIGTLDSVTGQIKGSYAYLRKIPISNTETKDTNVTVYFLWRR